MEKTIAERITERVVEKLGLPAEDVELRQDKGNNGVDRTGIAVTKNVPGGIKGTVLVPIDSLIRCVEEGTITEDEAVEAAAAKVDECVAGIPDGFEIDRGYILDNCRIRMADALKNLMETKGKPFRVCCDLIAMVTVPVEMEDGRGFMIMTCDLMERYGISEEELFRAAEENMKKEVVFENLSAILGSVYGEGEGKLFLLTNSDCIYGAGVAACKDIMKECAGKVGGEVYAIPSSIHEVLLFRKEEDEDIGAVCDIIRQVNETIVKPEEVLSDRLYGIREDGSLYIAG